MGSQMGSQIGAGFENAPLSLDDILISLPGSLQANCRTSKQFDISWKLADICRIVNQNTLGFVQLLTSIARKIPSPMLNPLRRLALSLPFRTRLARLSNSPKDSSDF
jgi:hypothetical protein